MVQMLFWINYFIIKDNLKLSACYCQSFAPINFKKKLTDKSFFRMIQLLQKVNFTVGVSFCCICKHSFA